MNSKKKHKLLFVSPSGQQYELGFLSPSRNGFVLGTSHIEGVDTSHLTIVHKKGKISAHITPQQHPKDKEYFLPMSKQEIVSRFKLLIENELIFQLSQE